MRRLVGALRSHWPKVEILLRQSLCVPGGVDLAFGAGLQDTEPQPLGARRFLHVSDKALGSRIVRVHEQGDYPGLGDQLGEQFEPLGRQLGCHGAEAREVAARLRETGNEAERDRVADAGEDDRDRQGCTFCCERRWEAAACVEARQSTQDRRLGRQNPAPFGISA